MRLFLLIIFLIIIPEPVMILSYLIMKKYFPNHKYTLWLELKVNNIKLFFKKIIKYKFIKKLEFIK